MAYSLHGFVVINDLIDNDPGETSTLGELSSYSATYSIEKGYYTLDSVPRVRLVSFRSKQNDEDTTVPPYVVEKCIQLASWLSQKATDGTFINDKDTVFQAINANFRTMLGKIKIGKLVQSNNSVFLPEWIEFTILNAAETDNKIKLWFADKSFKQQYPYYDIKVIPAFKDLDAYFGGREQVRALSVSIPDIHNERNKTMNVSQSGETLILTHTYEWTDPVDPSIKIPFPWTVLVYGAIGENLDIIKDATVKHVLANSKFDRRRWEQIFPDLFVPTEYIFSPFWDKYSLPNRQLIAGEHSPIVDYTTIVPHAKATFVGYDQTFLTKNMSISSNLYRSISFIVCGHAQNRLGPTKFEQKWPEYCLIRSVSEDFNRVSYTTQQFLHKLHELFHLADEYVLDQELPQHISKVERDGVIYLAMAMERIQYLCVAKYNFTHGKFKRT